LTASVLRLQMPDENALNHFHRI